MNLQYELERMLELNKRIIETKDRIKELNSLALSPKIQVLSGMPTGCGLQKNKIDEYMTKKGKQKNALLALQREYNKTWRSIAHELESIGAKKDEYDLLTLRFCRGLTWKETANKMRFMHGDKWNENRCFRIYRSLLTKSRKSHKMLL